MKRYALLAATAAVGGAVAFQGSVNLQASTPGTAQTGNLHITGKAKAGVFEAFSTAPNGITYGGDFRSASNQGRGVLGNASATTGATYGGLFQAASNGGRAVAGIAGSSTGTTYGGFFSSLSNQGRGVYGQATSLSGTTYGVYGKTSSPNGYGVFSEGPLHATGWITGPGGRFETNAEDQYASSGISTSPNGDTVGVYGSSASNEGRGVYGNATSGSGTTYGVYGRAVSAGGYGVYSEGRIHATGVISGNGSGLTGLNAASISSGVLSQARLPVPMNLIGNVFNTILTVQNTRDDIDSEAIFAFSNGSGVRGVGANRGIIGKGFMGVEAEGNRFGVYGKAIDATGVTYGVTGQSLSAEGWAIFASGPFGASGTKSFRIDHPLDPENKYLLHYSSESPMPQNFYVGNVKTDAKGVAWVTLPDYFSEINKNFKYQLTVVDDEASTSFVQVKVGRKIRDGKFMIMSSAPNTEVSWRVDADRNDLYVRNRPPKTVEQKQGPEKGKYQHPEFYGLGPERGMNYHPDSAKKVIKPAK